MPGHYRKDFGNSGEDKAASFLSHHDFQIIERNFRYGRHGEIDIIARRGCLIIFVEVKNRNSDRFGGALYSLSRGKIEKFKLTARHFLNINDQYNDSGYTFRYDMIAIWDNEVEWIEDIFR